MDRERWLRIDALFEAALDQPPGERKSFLQAHCPDDVALRHEVEALLAAAGEAGSFLQSPAPLPTTDDSDDADDSGHGAPPASDTGATIGPYRILREIGEGGMGAVYLAVRDDETFHKQVAIKLLLPGVRSVSLVRRFRAERQILATLEHPNIARLLDGGATADGRPYLVMEYIDGSAIDAYCDTHRLSVGERLAIFCRVCEAVHYAHQNLVVHRDIKPSNILVTEDGQPRLLDFGIAKLIEPGALPYPLEATRTDQRPMTPSYASPEQVRGRTVTTASDVYSLGVLLYNLLTGKLPHELRGLSPAEVDRMLHQAEPIRPSIAITHPELRTDDRGQEQVLTPGRIAELRRTRPQQLRRQLAGDLDHIVAKALRKEPAARYGSVEQLLQDLHRHRDRLPVLARQGSLGYSVGKLLRRHRLAAGAAGLIFALLVIFAGAMAHQATQTAQQRDRAEQVTTFLIDLFEIVDPGSARGNSIKARELLDRGAERVERELGDQPEVQANLRHAIGTVYLNLGLYDEAEPLLEAALAVREQRLDETDLEIARSLNTVAQLYRYQGRYPEAEALVRRALAQRDGGFSRFREDSQGAEDSEIAKLLRHLAILLRIQGRYAEAEKVGRHALALFERALGSDDIEVAEGARVIAGVLLSRGDDIGAEAFLRKALDIYTRIHGDDHVITGTIHQNFSSLYWARGQWATAERHNRSAIAIWERLLGPSHAKVGYGLHGLGALAKLQGRHQEAESHLRRALTIYEDAIGDHHSDIGNCLFEIGHAVLLQDRLDEAETFLTRSLSMREESLDANHPWTGESLRGLADLRRAQGRLADAEQLYFRAFEVWKLHPGHPGTAGIPEAYAEHLTATGRADDAAAILARAEAGIE